MQVTTRKMNKKVQSAIAVALVSISIASASVVSWYVTPESYAVTPYQNLAQHQQQQARLRAKLSGVDKKLANLIVSLNDLVNNQIPQAEIAASKAEDAASAAKEKAQATADRLSAAQSDKKRLEKQIENNTASYDDAKDAVAQLARNSFHSSNASKTMSVVSGAKSTSDYIKSMQSDAAVSRVEAKSASDAANAISTGKNRADRLSAIEDEIANLKRQADAQSAAAQAASVTASEKVQSLSDLREQTDAKSKELAQQKASLKSAAAKEAAEVVQAQIEVDKYNRKLAQEAAAAAARARARRRTSTAQYSARTSSSASRSSSVRSSRGSSASSRTWNSSGKVSQSSNGYAVPGNCGATATYCYGHPTGRTSIGGGAYPWSQCTWYAYRRRTALNLSVGSYMGNGMDWANTGRRLGYVVNRTPHVGAAIVFQPGQAGADLTYGHVAIVERVNSDGSILISECGAVYQGVAHTRIIYNPSAYEYVHY